MSRSGSQELLQEQRELVLGEDAAAGDSVAQVMLESQQDLVMGTTGRTGPQPTLAEVAVEAVQVRKA